MTASLSAAPSSAPRIQLGVIKATALLLGLSLCLGARAATPDTPRNDAPAYGQSGRQMHDGQRVEELHKQLNLDPSQEALWKQARETSDRLRQDMRETMRARHDKLRQALETKTPDLRALADQMDQDRQADEQKHKQAREAWLKLYDALNPEQKQKASRFLLGMANMMERHGMDRGSMGMHGPGEGGPRERGMKMPRQ